MGFRNRLTSATAVDTGQPAGAGARVYQGSDATGVYGVLEFRDGIGGDVPSTVTGRANLSPVGDGTFTAQGGGLTLQAGQYNATDGPRLSLQVESAPAGGDRPVARVSSPYEAISSATPSLAAGWSNYSGLEALRCYLLADGTVLLSGVLQNTSGAGKGSIGGSVAVGTVPVDYRPAVTALTQAIGQSAAIGRLDITPAGAINLVDAQAIVNTGYLVIRSLYRLDALTNP